MTMDPIELDIQETNELVFKVNVDGTDSKHRSRLFVETKDVSYCFEGSDAGSGNVLFIVPEGLIAEGKYESRVEVVVGSRLMVPMKFETQFKKFVTLESSFVRGGTIRESKEPEVEVKLVENKSSTPSLKDRWIEKNVPITSSNRQHPPRIDASKTSLVERIARKNSRNFSK